MATPKKINDSLSLDKDSKDIGIIEETSVAELSFLQDATTKKTLTGFNFWTKFLSAILGFDVFILSLYGLFSLVLVFFTPLALFIPVLLFALAAYLVYILINLWKSGSVALSLQNTSNQDEYNNKSIYAFDLIRQAAKLYVIGIVVAILSLAVFIMLSFAMFATFSTATDSDSFNIEREIQMPLRNYESVILQDVIVL